MYGVTVGRLLRYYALEATFLRELDLELTSYDQRRLERVLNRDPYVIENMARSRGRSHPARLIASAQPTSDRNGLGGMTLFFSMFLFAVGPILIAAPIAAKAAEPSDPPLWYAAHVGQSECVPLHEIDPNDVPNPVAFGDFARTPEAFVDELKRHLGPDADITLNMKSPAIAVVRVDAASQGFATVLIQGLDLCRGFMARVRSRK